MPHSFAARPPALLVLEDGRTFIGRSFGAEGETFGEAVFGTAMSGYQETLTDPSYRRQVVVATAPHIGNTGWNDQDDESGQIWVAGYVVRDAARVPSSWRSRRTLDQALADQGVVGVSEVDTRALTRHLRERGSMRVGLSTTESDPQALLARVLAQPQMEGADLVGEVTCSEPYVIQPQSPTTAGGRRGVFPPATTAGGRRGVVPPAEMSVVAVDLGIKAMTPRLLAEHGIKVTVVPAWTTFDQLQALRPDGVFFSNGPGDPAAADGPVALLRQVLAAGIPYFGICFGNQIFGRALGLGTFKLRYGHRGINQPVMDLTTRKVEITAHNHGFAVRPVHPDGSDADPGESIATPYGTARVSHVCLNDDVVEGLELERDGQVVAFSVQYHPEAAAGPHDAAYLFDRFVQVMQGTRTGVQRAQA